MLVRVYHTLHVSTVGGRAFFTRQGRSTLRNETVGYGLNVWRCHCTFYHGKNDTFSPCLNEYLWHFICFSYCSRTISDNHVLYYYNEFVDLIFIPFSIVLPEHVKARIKWHQYQTNFKLLIQIVTDFQLTLLDVMLWSRMCHLRTTR